MKRITRLIGIFAALVLLGATAVAQVPTAFNFQGRLNDGTSPANGRYDLQFKIFDAITGGNQRGAIVDKPNTMLVNGVFSTTLDFGETALRPDFGNVFLEVSVRPTGSQNPHVVLGARQQILSVPYAMYAQHSNYLGEVHNSQYARLNVLNFHPFSADKLRSIGDTYVGRHLQVDGNVTQRATGFGIMKAMLYVRSDGHILRCYNGFTGETRSDPYPCGFIVSQPLGPVGVYRFSTINTPNTPRLDFSNHFISVTADNSPPGPINRGASFRFFGEASVEVFTFAAGNSDDTIPGGFMIFIY